MVAGPSPCGKYRHVPSLRRASPRWRVGERLPGLLLRWAQAPKGPVQEQIVRNLDVPALIVPDEARGFVADTGELQLRQILIPARDASTARTAGDAARGLLASIGTTAPIEVTDVPLAAVIARAPEVSLIVMASHGHDGVADVLLGSPAERVLRDARCPVLCVAV